jgi:transcription initiation factor TFIID TATA-box-binding protein
MCVGMYTTQVRLASLFRLINRYISVVFPLNIGPIIRWMEPTEETLASDMVGRRTSLCIWTCMDREVSYGVCRCTLMYLCLDNTSHCMCIWGQWYRTMSFRLKKPRKRPDGPHRDDVILPAYPPTTRNVVCTCTVRRRLNMLKIADILHGNYVHKQFPSCNLASMNPKVACAIFGTGRFVLCGANNPFDALRTVYRYIRLIFLATGVSLEVYDFRVENIVKSVSWGFHINLDLFHDDHQSTSVFNPSVFVGCQYMPKAPRPVGIIFRSGRAVVTGCTNPGEAEAFIEKMNIKRYCKGKEYRIMPPENKRQRDCDRPKRTAKKQVKRKGTLALKLIDIISV